MANLDECPFARNVEAVRVQARELVDQAKREFREDNIVALPSPLKRTGVLAASLVAVHPHYDTSRRLMATADRCETVVQEIRRQEHAVRLHLGGFTLQEDQLWREWEARERLHMACAEEDCGHVALLELAPQLQAVPLVGMNYTWLERDIIQHYQDHAGKPNPNPNLQKLLSTTLIWRWECAGGANEEVFWMLRALYETGTLRPTRRDLVCEDVIWAHQRNWVAQQPPIQTGIRIVGGLPRLRTQRVLRRQETFSDEWVPTGEVEVEEFPGPRPGDDNTMLYGGGRNGIPREPDRLQRVACTRRWTTRATSPPLRGSPRSRQPGTRADPGGCRGAFESAAPLCDGDNGCSGAFSEPVLGDSHV